ncbi:MAG TPA: DUF3426 domain-containing protein [Caulobacteraceae bacterium]|jgi:predicted Zn finger-like uncharacterized protein
MILTCPECATGYFVDDSQMRAGGRKVRCANCGARWTAHPDGPLELVTSEQGALAREPGPAAAEPAPLTAEELPRVFRDRAEDERRMRRAAARGVAWGGAAVLVVALIAVGIVFRDGVVRAWPPTASLYAAVGLPVNPTGLVVEQVRFEPALHEGHATLDVSGVIRNVADRPVVAPPLQISILNTQGKRVAGQIATFDNARIPPGQTRHFQTSIFDPPYSAATLQFEWQDARTGAPAAHPVRGAAAPIPPPPGFALRGASADTSPVNSPAPRDNAGTAQPAGAPPANAAPVGR